MRKRLLLGALTLLVIIVAGAVVIRWRGTSLPGSHTEQPNLPVRPAAPSANENAEPVETVAPSGSPRDATAPHHTADAPAPSSPSSVATPALPAADSPPHPGAAVDAPSPQPSGESNLAAARLPVENTRNSVRDFRTRFGENPVGSNAEITAALAGRNSRGISVMPPGARVNDRGELLDHWGKPLFFHQISGREMEIRSSGPDGVMWNADDIVTK